MKTSIVRHAVWALTATCVVIAAVPYAAETKIGYKYDAAGNLVRVADVTSDMNRVWLSC